jgi:fluoride exporter
MDLVWVGVGGFVGAISRYVSVMFLGKRFPALTMPIGTLFVNSLGSFLIGLLLGCKANVELTLLIGTGFMGAFTTFSTFQYELLQFSTQRKWGMAFKYLLLSMVIGLVLAFAGYELGSTL